MLPHLTSLLILEASMPTVSLVTLRLEKRFALSISRGTRSGSEMMWLRLAQEGIEGWGEACEFSVGSSPQTISVLQEGWRNAQPWLESLDLNEWPGKVRELHELGIPTAVISAIDQAGWDWMGKKRRQPCWSLWGATTAPARVETSVTIGISSPDAAVKRVEHWLSLAPFRCFKIKLGSPNGTQADRLMFEAVQSAIPAGSRVSVDANGGWSLEDARSMARWLEHRGVDHVEQPLARGRDSELVELRRSTALPIILDESCWNSQDIAALASCADGINIKLMKCGGVSEALRMIERARAHGLKCMLGCYGNSSLANSAAAHLASWVDYIDLDSHFNLLNDPFVGWERHAGAWTVSDRPGFGVRLS